jgi:signal transduction histidine kinase
MREAFLPAPDSSTHLKNPWLYPARVLWLATTLVALGLFFAGLPARANTVSRTYRGDIQASLTQNQVGKIIVSPWSASVAVRAGVLEGDVLLAVNNVPVTSVEQADALLAGVIGTPVTISVQTGNFPPRQLTIPRSSLEGGILLRYGFSSRFAVIFVLASEILFTLVCAGIAVVIFWRRSDDWMALLASLVLTMILIGLSLPVIAFAQGLATSRNPPLIDVWYSLAFGLLLIFFYLFPAGKYPSRLTQFLTGILIVWTALEIFEPAWYPWYLPRRTYLLVISVWVATGIVALVYRYRYHSDAAQRQQIRWIVWGAAASALGLLLQIIPQDFVFSGSTRVVYDFVLYPLGQVFKLLLPLSISLAILRYRLWDIDLVINRVLVYGSLSALTMLGYLGTVFVLQALFSGLSSPVVSFFATGLVAILFEPLRQRLQRTVNRAMYGQRDDPYAVLTRLAGALETTPTADEILPTIARTIAQALKIPHVAILLDQDGEQRRVASFGAAADHLLSFPLVYHGETIGVLQLARRAPNEEFFSADRRLIENIAHQAGAAAQTVRLNTDLLRSRAQIVNEREDERLRIRHDLHDELGPILASQGLKLAAVRQMLRTQPEKAERLVDDIIQQSQQTIADIRRLVHGLRPPALDQLGLVEAVRDLIRYNGGDELSGGGLNFEISAPESPLPKLSAAVEVNAYRIVLEALANTARHAQARYCAVKIEVEPDTFVIQIQDDGIGMPKDYRAGVGLRSMRARAEEIGGCLNVEPVQPHGTHITVRLPLSI